MPLIQNPVQYTQQELNRIIFNIDKEWGDSVFTTLKRRIKNYLLGEQNYICPYCNFRIWRSSYYAHIEHIVPKAKYPPFRFEELNLAVSCQVCNNIKLDEETLQNPNPPNYPNQSIDFLIVHPHFDDWDDYLQIEEDIFITPINQSQKGKNTIEICGLNRLELAEDRACFLNINIQEHKKKLVLLLSKPNDPNVINSCLLRQITNFINTY